MDPQTHRQHLIEILQGAYSGELAAGFAYRGHWKSLKDPQERCSIQKIENDEWVHRKRVGVILARIGGVPRKALEVKLWMIGRSIGLACHLIGWFLPMYFAGRLESGNVIEYQTAADHAASLGLKEFEIDLLHMSGVEKEHEQYFLAVITGHRWLPFIASIFGWGLDHPDDQSVSPKAVTPDAME